MIHAIQREERRIENKATRTNGINIRNVNETLIIPVHYPRRGVRSDFQLGIKKPIRGDLFQNRTKPSQKTSLPPSLSLLLNRNQRADNRPCSGRGNKRQDNRLPG